MAPDRFDPRPAWAPLSVFTAGVLTLALTGLAHAAPLRLSLDTVAGPGPTAEAVEPAGAPVADPADAEAGEDLSFVAAPDLPFPVLPLPDLTPAPGAASPDDDWLQSARAQQDEAAVGTDRRLGDFAPAVPPALTISANPIDEVALPAARPQPAAAAVPGAAPQAEPWALPVLAWSAVPVLCVLLAAAGAAWHRARRGTRLPRARAAA